MSVTEHKILPKAFSTESAQRALSLARQTLQIEADAILAMKARMSDNADEPLARAVGVLLECQGRVVVSGIGTPNDVFIAISNSGETAELMAIVPIIKRMGAYLIAMTGNDESSLALLSAIHLNVGVDKEACTLNLAPTASTTATLAMGDALAVSLLDARGFMEEDFARSHPGGALGRRLLTHVRDVMRTGDAIPAVTPDVSLSAALMEITRKGMAITAVVDDDYRPIGVFPYGDLRRMIEKVQDFTKVM